MNDADKPSRPPAPGRIRRTRRRTTGAILVSALALGGAAAAAPSSLAPAAARDVAAASHHESGVRAALHRDVTDYLKQHGEAESASGVGLSVSLPGRRSTIDVAAGTMRFGHHRRLPSDAVWQTGSNTKAFTSVILLQLEAERRLSIDDTLGKWLPQYPQWRNVTIRSLLNMTARIPTYDETPEMLSAYVADPHRRFSESELVSYVASEPFAETPWTYSNTDYILAQMVIEKVTGTSYRDQLYARIINRLHLKNTFYRTHVYPRSVTKREPAGYFFTPGYGPMDPLYGTDVSRNTMSIARAAGGMLSTLHDLTVWTRALYSGHMLPPAQQAKLTSLVSEDTGEPVDSAPTGDNAFGLGVQQSTGAKMGTFWNYEGATFAHRVLHAYLPESGVIVAIGVNSYPGDDAIGQLLVNALDTLKAYGLTD